MHRPQTQAFAPYCRTGPCLSREASGSLAARAHSLCSAKPKRRWTVTHLYYNYNYNFSCNVESSVILPLLASQPHG